MSLLSRTTRRASCVFARANRIQQASRRPLSNTAYFLASPPHSEGPPAAKQAGKSSHPADDPQSSAGANDPQEANATGDDHPAKQPDGQAESDRSTGFHEVKGGVKGGKEGLGARTDKQ